MHCWIVENVTEIGFEVGFESVSKLVVVSGAVDDFEVVIRTESLIVFGLDVASG